MQTSTDTVAKPGIAATLITPGGGWRAVNVSELWRFRELLGFLVWRDVKVRYKQTVLGAAWAVLQPALMMAVFTVFIGKMAKAPGADDPVFVYAGMLPWTFFATAMANAGNSVVNSERLITKIYFPRLAIPLAAVGAAVVDFVIASLLLVLMMIWRGAVPGAGIFMAPIIFALIALAAIGVGALLAALTAAYRDFRYVIPFLVQFWLFATPPAYMQTPADSSTWVQTLIAVNPMSGLISAFRAAVFDGQIPWALLGISTMMVLGVFFLGCFYFRKVEDSFADIV
jgi:lipopolysaccharide transport system permease protein